MKIRMNAAVAWGAALLLSLSAEASLLYRGRLTQDVNGTTTFDEGTSYAMTFSLYALPQGGEALYQRKLTVPVNTQGEFEALLDDAGVDAVFTNGYDAVYVGLALEAGRELMPRRQILDLPLAAQAQTTRTLTNDPHIGELKSAHVTATTVSVENLVTTGTLTSADESNALTVRGFVGSQANGVDLSKKKLTLFGQMTVLVSGKATGGSGDALCAAPSEGLALVSETSGAVLVNDIQFCRSGDAIRSPIAGIPLTVRFYPFVGK